jgi:Kyakuja-Dileera-Zisupton transposase
LASDSIIIDTPDPDAEDTVNIGLNLPNSTYDTCSESFITADGNHVKASMTHFSDTGLVANLCRHDHVIYYINMWMAGEKQCYALALIDTIMKELPSDWHVGVLYNIGCQVHQSIIKWDLLPSGRLTSSSEYWSFMPMAIKSSANYGITQEKARFGVLLMVKGMSASGVISVV